MTRAGHAVHVTSPNSSEDNARDAIVRQGPTSPGSIPRGQEQEQAEAEASAKTGAANATEQPLDKKTRAERRESIARVQAARADQNLQKDLIERYGYSRHSSPSVADEPESIELSSYDAHQACLTLGMPFPNSDDDKAVWNAGQERRFPWLHTARKRL